MKTNPSIRLVGVSAGARILSKLYGMDVLQVELTKGNSLSFVGRDISHKGLSL